MLVFSRLFIFLLLCTHTSRIHKHTHAHRTHFSSRISFFSVLYPLVPTAICCAQQSSQAPWGFLWRSRPFVQRFLTICVQMGFLLFVLNETPNFKYSLSFGISIYCCKHCFDSDYCLMLSCDLEYAYSRRCVLMQLQVSSYSCDLEYAYSRCCVLIQLQVSSYCCICVLILLYVSSYCYTSSVLIYILSKLE
jgi:hypothetical protein